MKEVFRFFAKRNLLAYLITTTIVLLGIGTLTTIKRDTFPDVEFGEILITTTYPGASPEDVELKITNKIEKELKEVTGIKKSISWSRENVSTILLVIEPDVSDQNKVIRDIRSAVSRVTDLPEEVSDSPLISELGTHSFPMIEVGLSGNIPYRDLRELSRRFEKKLEQIPGVAKLDRFGYRAREIRVEVSPPSLAKYNLHLHHIVSAIKRRNIRATGGTFESYTSEKNIVTLAQFRQSQEVGELIVRASFDGPKVRIKDLAVVHDDFEAEKVMSRINGQSSISFIAYKSESADIIRTVNKIKSLVEEEKKKYPKGVSILVSNDASNYVQKRFDIVLTNGLIGLFFVVLVLTLFLNARVAFWVALGIPVSLLGVIFFLPIFDSFLDSVTMTAMVLVIGIVVDDAIIIAESIYHKMEQGLKADDAAVEGIAIVFKPVITTVLTTLVVFIPLFFMPGILGKFVYVIPLVIAIALLISILESTLALPAHLTAGSTGKIIEQRHSLKQLFFIRIRKWYWGFLHKLLKYRYALVGVFIAVLILSLGYAVKYMDFILFPSSTAERFVILAKTPIGTSLKATSDRTKTIEKMVSELPTTELHSFVTRIGTFGDIGDAEVENNAAIVVNLTPFASRKRTAEDIVNDLRRKSKTLKEFAEVRFLIDAGGPPVGHPITLRIVGPDDESRKHLADDIVKYLKVQKGVTDIDRDDKAGKNQVEIRLDYEKLARAGITVADVAQNVRIAYDGEIVTNVRFQDEDVNFRVIYPESVRKDPGQLAELRLPNNTGNFTKLGQLAKFETVAGPASIHHYDSERVITITGNVDKATTTSLKITNAVKTQFNVDRDYPGLRLVIGGEAEETQQSMIDLFIIMGLAAIGIYFFLVLLFNSLSQPFMVMFAIPFGITGVIIGFAIHQQALGFLAMTGIIGLIGVVVNDSLVLVNHINELRAIHPKRQMIDIVSEGTANRLRAIILTTVSTVAGLLPLAYGIGGSDPYMSPMALALGWGLFFATPLTLILIPCLYVIGHDLRKYFPYFRKQDKHT